MFHLTQWQHLNSSYKSSDVESKKKSRKITGREREGRDDKQNVLRLNIIDTFSKAGCS